jgi:hypothetical protein
MSEYTIGFSAVGNVVALALSSLFYMLGGRNNKLLRRLGCALVISVAVNVTSIFFAKWNAWLLLLFPMQFGMYSLGYGGEIEWLRVVKRFLVVAISVLCGVLCVLSLGSSWWLLLIHAFVASATVFFSRFNPIFAAAEEVMICVLLNGVILFYPFAV